MINVLINDTWGEGVASRVQRRYPFLSHSVVGDHKAMRHPHGHMVLERFLFRYQQSYIETHGVAPSEEVHVDFYPFLEYQSPNGWAKMFAQKDYVGCINSWGMPVGDIWQRARMKSDYLKSDEYAELQQLIGNKPIFFAAGNSDSSTFGKAHLGNDLNFLQYCLATELDNVKIIGSCDSRGKPSSFSSDGWVDVAYRGEQVYVWNPLSSRQETVQGTSFSNPEAFGDVLGRGITDPAAMDAYWHENALTAAFWPKDIMHPKIGHGVMLFGDDQVSTQAPMWHDEKDLTK